MTRRMEVTGTGLQESLPTPVTQKTLSLTEPAAVEWLLVQVAGRYTSGHQFPDSVTFTTDTPQSITLNEPSSHIPAQGYTFETILTPANEVSASIHHTGDSYKTPRGLILYTKRQTTDERWTSTGQTTSAFVWSGSKTISHSEAFTLGPRSGPTDLYITAVVIDNNDDDRPLVLEAAAGDRTTRIAENGPTHGNLLSITPLTLTQVSSATTEVTVTLRSPVEANGDSLVLVGVNVSYRCSNSPDDNDDDDDNDPPEEADLEVVKTVDNPTPNATEMIVYRTTVTNNGADEATGVRLADPLPAGLTYVPPYTASQGTYNEENGVWEVGRLANGAKAILTISAKVNNCTNGRSIIATAKILAANQFDTKPNNNQGSAVIQVGSGTPCYVYMPVVFKDYCASTYYMDDFDDPTSGWITGTYAEADYSYEPKPYPKEYRIFSKDRNSYPTSFSVSTFGPFKQYTVKVDVKWDKPSLGDEYGIIFGVRDKNDPRINGESVLLYRFVVNTQQDNEFLLTRYNGQGWISVVGWRIDNSHIYNGTSLNTLQVMCSDSSAAIYANGNLLWQGNLPASCSGELGLTSSSSYFSEDPKTDARFDNFEICGSPELEHSSKSKLPSIIVVNDSKHPHN